MTRPAQTKTANSRSLDGVVSTQQCPLRYAIKTVGKGGTESHRVTWCCKDRHGFMLKHWKCVGLHCEGCPLRANAQAHAQREGKPGDAVGGKINNETKP